MHSRHGPRDVGRCRPRRALRHPLVRAAGPKRRRLSARSRDEDPDKGDWGKPPHPSVTHRTAVLTDATENARVVGAARVICDGARTAHLQFICVEEERRGLGLGGALLAWVEAIAAEAFGAREVELEVDRSNDHAQAVYRKRGYAHEEETSAANRAWSENPTIRRVLGPPRVQRFVKRLDGDPRVIEPCRIRRRRSGRVGDVRSLVKFDTIRVVLNFRDNVALFGGRTR